MSAERPWFDRQATLLHLVHVLRKRQMTVALFTLTLMVTVTIGTMVSTPFYRSAATVEISPNAPSSGSSLLSVLRSSCGRSASCQTNGGVPRPCRNFQP